MQALVPQVQTIRGPEPAVKAVLYRQRQLGRLVQVESMGRLPDGQVTVTVRMLVEPAVVTPPARLVSRRQDRQALVVAGCVFALGLLAVLGLSLSRLLGAAPGEGFLATVVAVAGLPLAVALLGRKRRPRT
jgi:hypothetical protein